MRADNYWPFRHQSWSWLGLIVIAVMLLAACGCGEARSPATVAQQSAPGVGALIRGCGAWILRAGIIAISIGILGLVASAFVAFLVPLRKYLGELAIMGAAALVLGASLIWLGDNSWILWGTVLAASAFAIWRYWPRLWRYARQVRA